MFLFSEILPPTASWYQRGASDLLGRLCETSTLLALAVNPLLLTMIAMVHRFRGTLPGARIELYQEICEVFLGKLQEARGILQDLRTDQRQLVLQRLATVMMRDGVRDIAGQKAEQAIVTSLQQVSMSLTPRDFLQGIHNTSGLLLERELGVYSFSHKTFQEYLTAISVKEERWEQFLVSQVHHGWWHETIRLYCAKADATPIIEACLQTITTETLILALECQREAFCIEQATQHRLQAVIDQGIEDADPERRRITAEVWLLRRTHQMSSLNEMSILNQRTFIDTSPVTHAEYQLFLDEQRSQDKYHQPDHWTSTHFSPGQGSAPVRGVRSSDAQAFCVWLTERQSGPWRYRLPTSDEVKKMKAVDKLPKDLGYWTDEGKAFAWPNGHPFILVQRKHSYFWISTNNGHFSIDRNFNPYSLDNYYFKKFMRIFDFQQVINYTRRIDIPLSVTCLNLIFDGLEQALARAAIRAVNLDHVLERDRDCARIIDGHIIKHLDHAIDQAVKTRNIIITSSRDIGHFYQCVGYLTKVIASHIIFHLSEDEKIRDSKIQLAIDSYLDSYVAFAFLQGRIGGILTASEGIFLVKEWQQDI